MWLAFQRQRLHKFPGPKITPRVFNWEIWFYNGSRSHIFLTEPKINHYISESMWWKNLPVNHRSSKRKNQIYLIFIFSFLYFEGRGPYMEAITINQETILSSKKGVISQWSRHANVLLGFLFMCHVADIIADIKWKNFQCKRLSQSRRYFGLLALIFFTKIPLWMYRLKAEEGSFMIIATIVVKFKSIVRTLKYFKGWTFILQCRSFFSYCCIQSNWLCFKGEVSWFL